MSFSTEIFVETQKNTATQTLHQSSFRESALTRAIWWGYFFVPLLYTCGAVWYSKKMSPEAPILTVFTCTKCSPPIVVEAMSSADVWCPNNHKMIKESSNHNG